METESPRVEPKAISEELKSPYCIALFEKARIALPENEDRLKRVFQEIDTQAIDSFTVFESKRFPGTRMSYFKLSVTEDLVKELRDESIVHKETDKIGEEDKDEIAFMFSALGGPPDGNAFNSQDMAIDRFFRNLPRVARAIREGRTPPRVDIYQLGTGAGLGETVSDDFVNSVKKLGLEPIGANYADFIEQTLNERDLNKTHVLLQGASLGAGTADVAFDHLPEPMQGVTQKLFDNPTGAHSPFKIWKFAQVGLGFIGEFAVRKFKDPVAKSLDEAKPSFNEYLMKEKNIPQDDPEQLKLKKAMVGSVSMKLLTGYGQNESGRAFVRKGVKDPTSTNPFFLNRGIRSFSSRGRVLEGPMNRAHSFTYENFSRWNQVLNYCK